MLWTAFHRWRKGSRFAFNRYRHYNIVVMVDEPGRPALILLSKEGVAQGCCFGMYLYGIGLMPLCERVRARVRRTLQAWYADDMCGAATARQNAAMMQALEDLGPKYGYFANSGKSCLQMEWQYLSRVTEGTAHLFEPLERSIRQEFLPALLDVPPEHIGGEFRETLAMSVRNGGIGV
ncbi:hypothetical protein ACHAWF_000906, partial [Thalassiosira exigua]